MVFSICITTQNTKIAKLLFRLHEQAQLVEMDVEFCIGDSGSGEIVHRENKKAAELYRAKYFYYDRFMCHGAMKNKLAKAACGSYLLFIHGDMHITHRRYLATFAEVMQPGLVIHGGISASGRKPSRDYQLHWQAMRTMLTFHSDERNKHPYYHFNTNNTLIPRGLFLQFPMPDRDDIAGLLPFAFRLKTNEVPVIHIDNPLSTNLFLSSKRFLAVSRKQMWQTALWLQNIDAKEKAHISIYEYNHWRKLQKWRIVKLYRLLYQLNTRMLILNIDQQKPTKLRMYKNFRRWMLIDFFSGHF